MQVSALIVATLLATSASGHVPFMDDGSHTSFATAWSFPDALQTRFLMLSFDCPSVTTWSKVTIQEETPWIAIGVGLPNITSLHDYRPSLWIVGQNITVPATYQAAAGLGADLGLLPRVPRGFAAIEFPTEGSPTFVGFAERSSGISGYALLSANVTLTGVGDVYFAVQPLEHRRGRAFISLGSNETAAPMPGSADEITVQAWFSEAASPRVGQACTPWSG
jgi:hypothetical protein